VISQLKNSPIALLDLSPMEIKVNNNPQESSRILKLSIFMEGLFFNFTRNP
jgi:hypothetical protein